jgi:Rrf2 family protein
VLRISRKADYAVFLLGCIARQGAYPHPERTADPEHAEHVVSANELARQAGLNKSVVANLLKELARHGLLDSTRGLKGGYRLTAAPEQVTFGRILQVVDGPFALVDCLRDPHAGNAEEHECSLIAFCPSKNPMRVVHTRIERLFAEITLAELCGLQTRPPAATLAATLTATLTGAPR